MYAKVNNIGRIFYRCVDWNATRTIPIPCSSVASFTDAWIETIFSMRLSRMTMVASFTDAWIETWVKSTLIPSPSVASFTDAWIETEQQWRAFDAYQRRIFYRCVDWNPNMGINEDDAFSRIFYRCVDWNNSKKSASVIRIGRIFYRCVDWNFCTEKVTVHDGKSHLLQMRGLKRFCFGSCRHVRCRIFYRCVDWNF